MAEQVKRLELVWTLSYATISDRRVSVLKLEARRPGEEDRGAFMGQVWQVHPNLFKAWSLHDDFEGDYLSRIKAKSSLETHVKALLGRTE